MKIYVIVGSIVGFLSMYIDKQNAMKHRSRIKEKHLLIIALLTGGIGSLVGMYGCHHKTRKPQFYIGIPIIVIMEMLIYFKWIY